MQQHPNLAQRYRPDPLAETSAVRGFFMDDRSASEKTLAARIAAEESWANTPDRSARTAPARQALWQRFLDDADGDPVRAEHARRAHYSRLALKSAQARRRKGV